MKFAVIGNCQSTGVAKILSICPDVNITFKVFNRNTYKKIIKSLNPDEYSWVFIQKYRGREWDISNYDILKNRRNVIYFPVITFTGSHPDCIHIQRPGGLVFSPIGHYHSSIIANSFINGLTEEECENLFSPIIYALLGFYEMYQSSLNILKEELSGYGLDGEYLTERWSASGAFMHTINHPKLHVIEDTVKNLCRLNQIQYDDNIRVGDLVSDNLLNAAIFPVYPGVWGSASSAPLVYKRSSLNPGVVEGNGDVLRLKSFITESYKIYQEHDGFSELVSTDRKKMFRQVLASAGSQGEKIPLFAHPYRNLPDHNFWDRSVSGINMQDVNPIVNFKFMITPDTRIATAGSCFAQHIARALLNSGFNYYVTEAGPENLTEAGRRELGCFLRKVWKHLYRKATAATV